MVRRDFMKLSAFAGLGSVVVLAAPKAVNKELLKLDKLRLLEVEALKGCRVGEWAEDGRYELIFSEAQYGRVRFKYLDADGNEQCVTKRIRYTAGLTTWEDNRTKDTPLGIQRTLSEIDTEEKPYQKPICDPDNWFS